MEVRTASAKSMRGRQIVRLWKRWAKSISVYSGEKQGSEWLQTQRWSARLHVLGEKCWTWLDMMSISGPYRRPQYQRTSIPVKINKVGLGIPFSKELPLQNECACIWAYGIHDICLSMTIRLLKDMGQEMRHLQSYASGTWPMTPLNVHNKCDQRTVVAI